MARRSEGLKLVRRDSGLYYARFTHAGRRYDIATGESELAPAQVAAAKIYGDVVAGRWAPGGREAAPAVGAPFDEVAARWLAHTIADAICDRLVHNAHVIGLKGPSGREKKGLRAPDHRDRADRSIVIT